MNLNTRLKSLAIISTLLTSNAAIASEVEVSLMLGQMYSSDLVASDNSDIDVDSAANIAIGVAWQETKNGQGQVLLNRVSHDFKGENGENDSVDIIYAHFNGVALFRQQNYVTSMSIGAGGAYFDADNGSDELYPSATISFGTRYEFSDTLALVTELRAYATLVDDDDNMFCRADVCSANFDNSLWVDSTISIGIAMKF